MSTPENSNNPLCRPISKSLLTPCRRPGLSRKIKTPLQVGASLQYTPLDVVKTPKPDNRNNVIAPILTYATTESPKKKPELYNTPRKHEHIAKPIKEERLSTKSKTKVCQKEEREDSTSEFENSHNKANESTVKLQGTKTLIVKLSSRIDDVSHKSNANRERSPKVILLQSEKAVCSDHTNKLDVIESKPTHQRNDRKSELELENTEKKLDVISTNNENKKRVTIKKSLKRLSMKRSASSDHKESDFDDTQDSIESINSMQNGVSSKAKKSRTLFNEELDLDTILNLQNRVKAKREKLESLKRAATYRKLHNAEDLQTLINIWSSGCRKAIHQLFEKLQTHGTITMECLIEKFNIPEGVM